jgi:hypothetical protein
MSQKKFTHPVRLHFEQFGTIREVSDVHQALDCMMSGWPDKRGSAHGHALDMCLKVLAGQRSGREAEQAFIEAATEAGILLQSPKPR